MTLQDSLVEEAPSRTLQDSLVEEAPLVGSTLQNSLVEAAPSSTLWCGCLPSDKLFVWRGDGSNRTLWKAFCSLLLVAYMGVYFYLVQDKPVLILIAAFTLTKFLIETWGQDTPTWVVPGGPVMLVVMYAGVLPWIIYSNGLCTQNQDIMFPYRGVVGAAVFFGGSTYALRYEMGRFACKELIENKGKLHTEGLASYCMHPNYLGDLFTYTGWAIACGTTCSLATPMFMVWSFVIIVCPNSDAYLAQRYPLEFPAYMQDTATLIPGLRSSMASLVLAWLSFAVSMYLGGRCAGQCG